MTMKSQKKFTQTRKFHHNPNCLNIYDSYYNISHHSSWEWLIISKSSQKGFSKFPQVLIPTILIYILLGHAPMGARTIALDPTFGSFTLLKPISHYVNQFLWWKCLHCFGVQNVNTVGRYTTSYLLARPACFVMPCLF